MSKHLTPLEVCERLIGPPPKLATIAGLHEKSAWPWRRSSHWRDAGDLPSSRVQRALLNYARLSGRPIKPEWLIEGAPAAEIDALVASLEEAA